MAFLKMRKFLSICFLIGVVVTLTSACNETDPSNSIVLTQCCRDGRDGRDGISVMGPRGLKGCKGDSGKDGKQGPTGLPCKCDDSEVHKLINTLNKKVNLQNGLIGHWKMDEEVGNFVDDDSGYGLHGMSSGTTITRGKFSRGRKFNSTGFIAIPNSESMKFGTGSFSFAGWLNIENYTYPLTNIGVQQGYGCYFQPGRPGFTPGWDIGHGFTNGGTNVCIRDENKNFIHVTLKHNKVDHTWNLLRKWTHYVVVFNRLKHKILLYINAKKQDNEIDISKITGSIDNDQQLVFGFLYGWKTKGAIDEYRLYNIALDSDDVEMIYKDKNL